MSDLSNLKPYTVAIPNIHGAAQIFADGKLLLIRDNYQTAELFAALLNDAYQAGIKRGFEARVAPTQAHPIISAEIDRMEDEDAKAAGAYLVSEHKPVWPYDLWSRSGQLWAQPSLECWGAKSLKDYPKDYPYWRPSLPSPAHAKKEDVKT